MPNIFSNPLNLCNNLINNISKNNSSYNLDTWVEEVEKLKEIVIQNKNDINELYKMYETKNINKLRLKIGKVLSRNSHINNIEFGKICKEILTNVIFDKNISKQDRKKLVDFSLKNTRI